MGIKYRRLREADLDTFIQMRIAQLREEGTMSSEDLAAPLLSYYQKHMRDETFASWLALDDENIIATSGISFIERPPTYSCPNGKIGILSSMYTLEEYRRKGIAAALLDKIMLEAKNYGCGTVQITGSDMGILLYRAYGFKKNDNFMYYSL